MDFGYSPFVNALIMLAVYVVAMASVSFAQRR